MASLNLQIDPTQAVAAAQTFQRVLNDIKNAVTQLDALMFRDAFANINKATQSLERMLGLIRNVTSSLNEMKASLTSLGSADIGGKLAASFEKTANMLRQVTKEASTVEKSTRTVERSSSTIVTAPLPSAMDAFILAAGRGGAVPGGRRRRIEEAPPVSPVATFAAAPDAQLAIRKVTEDAKLLLPVTNQLETIKSAIAQLNTVSLDRFRQEFMDARSVAESVNTVNLTRLTQSIQQSGEAFIPFTAQAKDAALALRLLQRINLGEFQKALAGARLEAEQMSVRNLLTQVQQANVGMLTLGETTRTLQQNLAQITLTNLVTQTDRLRDRLAFTGPGMLPLVDNFKQAVIESRRLLNNVENLDAFVKDLAKVNVGNIFKMSGLDVQGAVAQNIQNLPSLQQNLKSLQQLNTPAQQAALRPALAGIPTPTAGMNFSQMPSLQQNIAQLNQPVSSALFKDILGGKAANAFRETGVAKDKFRGNLTQLDDEAKKMNFQQLFFALFSLQRFFGGFTLGRIASDVRHFSSELKETAEKFQNINQLFTVAAGGNTEEAARMYAVSGEFAKKYGLELTTTAQAYARLAAAARGTSLEGAGVQKVFEAASAVQAVLGTNTEATSHLLLAFEQILSKGRIQSEELVKQL
jgi:hypothetical protein